ncbi:hypothetical protein BSL78_28799 [Apostichopus japonicus]|uniref:Zinc finger PHD-type domain-containing protein n=1 Tax=Stichopus japonicus TaxID=307972 RepID=A0A2G8JF66_STIJA|nr:hypothetical protein BSL78_28799 [Apostichopus japonicus]
MHSTGFVPESGEFVQVVNMTNSHWVVLSNIGVTGPNVRLFDSYVAGRKSYPLDIVKAAACLLQTKESELFIHVMNVTQQTDGSSRGVFALAFASTLCAGEDPTKMHYDEGTMWQELINNLNDLQMLPFGIRAFNRSVKRRRIQILTEGIFCTCRRPDDGNTMALCAFCNEWFHEACVRRIPRREFYCSFCQRRLSKRKVKASKERMGYIRSFQDLVAFKNRYGVHKWHDVAVQLYNFVDRIAFNNTFPDVNEKLAVLEKQPEHLAMNIRGLTLFHTDSADGFDLIYINGPCHKSPISLYETLIHEMAHAKVGLDGRNPKGHGLYYKKVGRKMIKLLNDNSQSVPIEDVINVKFNINILMLQ